MVTIENKYFMWLHLLLLYFTTLFFYCEKYATISKKVYKNRINNIYIAMGEYKFEGLHYIASFKDCKLIENASLVSLFEDAIRKSGATILNYNEHKFHNDGITFVFLLSESHCSVHTYPEHNSLFVDLFTCGDKIDHATFHSIIIDALKPDQV
jgi:S-adenosylmethionine decarboxylase